MRGLVHALFAVPSGGFYNTRRVSGRLAGAAMVEAFGIENNAAPEK